MPTTQREAEYVKEAVLDTITDFLDCYGQASGSVHIDSFALAETIFDNLIPLAYQTENYSLRQSLFMVYKLFNPDFVPDFDAIRKIMAVYEHTKPEMSPQEFAGLSDADWELFVSNDSQKVNQ